MVLVLIHFDCDYLLFCGVLFYSIEPAILYIVVFHVHCLFWEPGIVLKAIVCMTFFCLAYGTMMLAAQLPTQFNCIHVHECNYSRN